MNRSLHTGILIMLAAGLVAGTACASIVESDGTATYAQAKAHYEAGGQAWAEAWGASDVVLIRQYLDQARTAYTNCLNTTAGVDDPANAANLALIATISTAYIDLADAALAMYDGADIYGAGRSQMAAGNFVAAAASFESAGETFAGSQTLFGRATTGLQSATYAGTEYGDGTAYTAVIVPILNAKGAYMGEFATYSEGWQHTALAYQAYTSGDQATFRSEATEAMTLFDGLRASPSFGGDAAGNAAILATMLGSVPTATPTPLPSGEPRRIVHEGDIVFIGEYGLDLTMLGIADGATLAWFAAGSNAQTGAPDETIVVPDVASFNVVPGTRAGVWYNMNNRAPVITVHEPSLNLRVWDVQANQDVTDRTVVRGRLLSFRIDSNLDAVRAQRDAPATVTIRVQDPAGNVYSALVDDTGTQNRLGVQVLSGSMVVAGAGTGGAIWDTANPNYPAAEYRVWAESNLNGMKDNYKDPSGADYTGRTITSLYTVTIGDDELTIEATADSVVRNNDFAVLITGRPETQYSLSVEGSGANPPTIKPGQAGVLIDGANPSAAVITTDSTGRRTVGFSTNPETGTGTYTIRVDELDPVMGLGIQDTVAVGVG